MVICDDNNQNGNNDKYQKIRSRPIEHSKVVCLMGS